MAPAAPPPPPAPVDHFVVPELRAGMIHNLLQTAWVSLRAHLGKITATESKHPLHQSPASSRERYEKLIADVLSDFNSILEHYFQVKIVASFLAKSTGGVVDKGILLLSHRLYSLTVPRRRLGATAHRVCWWSEPNVSKQRAG